MDLRAISPTPFRNTEFAIGGVNHVALVCSDMDATLAFYRDVLGMPLVKNIELPNGFGHHFFFGLGNGDCLAFFHFTRGIDAAPGVAAPAALPGIGSFKSAAGSMNHLAFDVPADKFNEYRERLISKGVAVSDTMNHDDSPAQVSELMTEAVYVRSIYFFDPDGVLLEFACWTNEGMSIASDQRLGVTAG